jgi:hypothetical protein
MRISLGPVLLYLFLSIASAGAAQVSAIPDSTLLQHSLGALTRNGAVNDIVLSGTARRIAGADDESGSVTLQAIASGESRLEMSFASGNIRKYGVTQAKDERANGLDLMVSCITLT